MSENTKTGGNSEKSGKPKKKLGNPFPKWYREYKAELKKIVWPTMKQTQKNTTIVIVLVIVVAAVIAVLDYVFSAGLMRLNTLF